MVNGTEMPRNSNGAESSPRRPKTSSSARPATDGGRTMGRSTTASSQPLPRNRRRARTKASGSPRVTVMTRLMAVVTRLSQSASSDRRRGDGDGQRAIEDRSQHEREDREAQEQREEGGQQGHGTLCPAPSPPTGGNRVADRSWRPQVGDGVRVPAHDGGRNPSSLRIAWPSGPASQSRKAFASAACAEALTTTPS